LQVLAPMCFFSEYNIRQTFQLIHKDAQLAGVVSNLYWVYMIGQIEPLNQAREFSTNRGAIYVFKVSWFTGVFDRGAAHLSSCFLKYYMSSRLGPVCSRS
jgi:hypothetical protein